MLFVYKRPSGKEKNKEFDSAGFKIWYKGKIKHRNGVRIIVYKNINNNVLNNKLYGYRIIFIKVILWEEVLNVISALYLSSWTRWSN